jgi:hypothetical protein
MPYSVHVDDFINKVVKELKSIDMSAIEKEIRETKTITDEDST